MAETTNIAWCDATFNPWIGCTKVGPGCDGCYAAVSTPARSLGVVWGAGQARRRTSAANWKKPIQWNARPFYECRDCGWRGETKSNCPSCAAEVTTARRRVFCASLADVFDNEVDPAWRADLFDLIYNTPNLDWLLLTKRIGNAEKMLDAATRDTRHRVGASRGAPAWAIVGDSPWRFRPWPNVWLGATIVNQEEADRDIPKLLATPAAKRFVSYEPALGPVEWRKQWFSPQSDGQYMNIMECGHGLLDWIIVGGESAQPGHPARPFDIQWARDTVRQCREAGVAVFVKQIGSRPFSNSYDDFRGELGVRMRCGPAMFSPSGLLFQTPCDSLTVGKPVDRAGGDPAEWPEDLRVREFPDAVARAA